MPDAWCWCWWWWWYCHASTYTYASTALTGVALANLGLRMEVVRGWQPLLGKRYQITVNGSHLTTRTVLYCTYILCVSRLVCTICRRQAWWKNISIDKSTADRVVVTIRTKRFRCIWNIVPYHVENTKKHPYLSDRGGSLRILYHPWCGFHSHNTYNDTAVYIHT